MLLIFFKCKTFLKGRFLELNRFVCFYSKMIKDLTANHSVYEYTAMQTYIFISSNIFAVNSHSI